MSISIEIYRHSLHFHFCCIRFLEELIAQTPLPNYILLGKKYPQASVHSCGGAATWFSCRTSSSDLSSDTYDTLHSCVYNLLVCVPSFHNKLIKQVSVNFFGAMGIHLFEYQVPPYSLLRLTR